MSQQTQSSSRLEERAVVRSPLATNSLLEPSMSLPPSTPIKVTLLHFASAIALTLVAFLLRLALMSVIDASIPFITFYPAIIIASLYGGWRAGLLCSALSVLASAYFMSPVGNFSIHTKKDWVGLAIFTSISIVLVLLTESQRKARCRAEASAEVARHRQEQVETLQKEMELRLQEREQQARLLETLLNNIPTGITIAEPPDVRIHKESLHGELISGMSSMELEGKRQSEVDWRIYHADGVTMAQEAELPLTRATLHGEVIRGEEWVLVHQQTGDKKHILCNASPVQDETGTIRYGILAWSDISATKAAQGEIAHLNERLHRAVYEASHRIKNQLQVILATADMAMMDSPENVSAEDLRRLTAQIKAIAVTHDLLTYDTRADGTTDHISLKALIERILIALQQTLRSHILRYTLDDVAVPIKMATSIAHLTNEAISNAVKHGGGEVEVRLSVNETHIRLEVCDNGPGFPVDFEPYRAANTGLELLLTLTRTDLNGDVEFTNQTEGGGRVIITCPKPA